MDQIKPFLRWAGGKTRLLSQIIKFVPKVFRAYHEPFLGSGSAFFKIASLYPEKEFFLSDSNAELINTYEQIKENPELLFEHLSKYQNTEEFYYRLRNLCFEDSIEKAAAFLYLNRTSFNGIYRVNKLGRYNVPFGFRKLDYLFHLNDLQTISGSLKTTKLSSVDFATTISMVSEGDLVFLDPPYTVMHENNGFVQYNQKIFSWDDQIRLFEFIRLIKSKRAYYILTNAKHESIYSQFAELDIPVTLTRTSTVGGKHSSRKLVEEYLFTNLNSNPIASEWLKRI